MCCLQVPTYKCSSYVRESPRWGASDERRRPAPNMHDAWLVALAVGSTPVYLHLFHAGSSEFKHYYYSPPVTRTASTYTTRHRCGLLAYVRTYVWCSFSLLGSQSLRVPSLHQTRRSATPLGQQHDYSAWTSECATTTKPIMPLIFARAFLVRRPRLPSALSQMSCTHVLAL